MDRLIDSAPADTVFSFLVTVAISTFMPDDQYLLKQDYGRFAEQQSLLGLDIV